MTSNCELSVIIPIYNGERFLRETLDSVLNQSFSDFELILVDDGSTDNTGSICEEYAAKDERVKVLHQKNGGMSNARDNGAKMAAAGTWIAFLDADDIFEQNMFRDMMQYKEADIVCTCYKNVLSSKISEEQFETRAADVQQMSGMNMLCRLFATEGNSGDICRLWGMLLRRSFYDKMESVVREAQDMIPQNYLNDVYCIPRFLYYAEKIAFLNKIYIFHRISRYTDSRQLKPNALHYELALVNKMNVEFYREKRCEFAYKSQLIGFYLVVLKIWYQTVTRETDKAVQKCYKEKMEEYYKEYYDMFKSLECDTAGERLVKWSVQLFSYSKFLWKLLVGNIRYGIMYRLQA